MEKQKLLKVGGIYFISSIVANIVMLFLISLQIHNLSTAQFGEYSIIASMQGLLSIFITVGIYSGMSRFIYEYEDKNRVKNIALTFSLIWGSLMILLGFFVSPIISKLIFAGDVNGHIYLRFVVTNSVLLCLISVYDSYYSMIYMAVRSGLIKFFIVVFTLVFSFYFLSYRGFKIEGILCSQFCAYIIIALIILISDLKNIRFAFSKKELKELLKYGLGLVPGQVSAWVLTLIDRYFIQAMVNLNAVAIYSLGYKIGMLIEPVFINPFKSVFTPFKFQMYKEKDGKEKIKAMFRYYNLIGWFCIFGLAIFAKLGVEILGTHEYIYAYKIVPIIAFSYYLWGLGSFYGLGLHLANKMVLNSGIVTIGAAVNIVLNIVLIRKMQYVGAAMSTVISYIIMNIIYYFCGKKYYDIGVNLISPYKYGLIFVILYPLYYLISLNLDNICLEIPCNILLCIVYLALNIIIGFISVREVLDIIIKIQGKFIFRRKADGKYTQNI